MLHSHNRITAALHVLDAALRGAAEGPWPTSCPGESPWARRYRHHERVKQALYTAMEVARGLHSGDNERIGPPARAEKFLQGAYIPFMPKDSSDTFLLAAALAAMAKAEVHVIGPGRQAPTYSPILVSPIEPIEPDAVLDERLYV